MVRKTVTLVFCDVADSTPLGERLDPKALRGVWSRYHETAREVLERHGGTIEKFVGDAVLAVFGIPLVHEDDALRAVRAAVELRDELTRLNDELELAYGVRIGVRTGVRASPSRSTACLGAQGMMMFFALARLASWADTNWPAVPENSARTNLSS